MIDVVQLNVDDVKEQCKESMTRAQPGSSTSTEQFANAMFHQMVTHTR